MVVLFCFPKTFAEFHCLANVHSFSPAWLGGLLALAFYQSFI